MIYKEERINQFRMLYTFILNEYVLFIYLFIYFNYLQIIPKSEIFPSCDIDVIII